AMNIDVGRAVPAEPGRGLGQWQTRAHAPAADDPIHHDAIAMPRISWRICRSAAARSPDTTALLADSTGIYAYALNAAMGVYRCEVSEPATSMSPQQSHAWAASSESGSLRAPRWSTDGIRRRRNIKRPAIAQTRQLECQGRCLATRRSA